MTAVEKTGEKWFEAEVHRIAGEVALIFGKPDGAKAQANLERALAVARQQQAKSWEPRAAMSMARLWRDQGKRDEAGFSARSKIVEGLTRWIWPTGSLATATAASGNDGRTQSFTGKSHAYLLAAEGVIGR